MFRIDPNGIRVESLRPPSAMPQQATCTSQYMRKHSSKRIAARTTTAKAAKILTPVFRHRGHRVVMPSGRQRRTTDTSRRLRSAEICVLPAIMRVRPQCWQEQYGALPTVQSRESGRPEARPAPRERMANHQPDCWSGERPLVRRKALQRSRIWLTRPITIHVVAKANSPSSNRAFSRHPIDKPSAIVAVINSRPRRLNWNHRLGVLLAVSISGAMRYRENASMDPSNHRSIRQHPRQIAKNSGIAFFCSPTFLAEFQSPARSIVRKALLTTLDY